MSSFFTLPASQRKRKREDRNAIRASKKRGVAIDDGKRDRDSIQRRGREEDQSISGSDSDDDENIGKPAEVESSDESSSSSDEAETAADRRRKLAERYLDNIRAEVDEVGFDAAEIDRDLIAERLKEDVDESKGRIFRQVASKLDFSTALHAFFRADTQTTTSIAIHYPYVYTVSKDRTLIKWELAKHGLHCSSTANGASGVSRRAPRPIGGKPKNIKFVRGLREVPGNKERQGHSGNILKVAVSPSGKYAVTGGADRKMIIWDAETLTPLKTFTHHRDAVSGLSFARQISKNSSGEQLFSGSFDRTIKTWSLSSAGHAYVETLFGHQDNVTSVASMATDQCVSVGARDRTARLWKIIDETQLVFRGGSSKHAEYHDNSLDCVAVIPPAHFVTGSDSGSLSLWSMHKKKPLYTIPLAHGLDPIPPLDELSPEVDRDTAAHNSRFLRRMPRWITALAAVPGTDIVLSGSWDGWIRAWKVSEDKKIISPLGPVGADPCSLPSASSSLQMQQTLILDGVSDHDAMALDAQREQETERKKEPEPLMKGVVNDIAVFERRPESSKPDQDFTSTKSKSSRLSNKIESNFPDSQSCGLCIVAALGKEHRLGRWKCFANNRYDGPSSQGRNGAVVFEVSFLDTSADDKHEMAQTISNGM
ncbi:hypothetical protein Egran_01787 [Elaphomyces granulatus]|uniref:Ribosomal RNA-processing protein 9 n=1 Tax=Elaphomyces granulatus TaxID=519963 RepID=A0A232M215_9EURO|nr:hypothetical protein Egran_01787 [Elaphomyces granulatus]